MCACTHTETWMHLRWVQTRSTDTNAAITNCQQAGCIKARVSGRAGGCAQEFREWLAYKRHERPGSKLEHWHEGAAGWGRTGACLAQGHKASAWHKAAQGPAWHRAAQGLAWHRVVLDADAVDADALHIRRILRYDRVRRAGLEP